MSIFGAWSVAQENKLKELWASGMTASQIAGELPFSRSAILGKVSRLKLPLRGIGIGGGRPKQHEAQSPRIESPQPAPRPGKIASISRSLGEAFSEPKQRRNPTNIAEKIAIAEAEPGLPPILRGEAPDGTGIKFCELRPNTCRWPRGDPMDADFEFCGGKSLPELPYCSHHSRLAYAPPKARVAADRWALHRADLKS
jgi:GcrA cell cycle regulator